MDFKHITYAKTDLWHYGVRLIYIKRAASRRVKPPPRTKERPTDRNAERPKASPLNRLAIAFVNSLGGVLATVSY